MLSTTECIYLSLRNGSDVDLSWRTISLLAGEYSMPNTGESPRDVRESTLSQILEVSVPERYYLSPKACMGILKRAASRGKALPEVLRVALEEQSRVL